MPLLTFLHPHGGKRYQKRYRPSPQGVEALPYKLPYHVTPETVAVSTPEQLLASLRAAGDSGACFFTGKFPKPFVAQSRAGRHDPKALHHVLVVDVDGIDMTLKRFMKHLRACGVTCSGVWHYSSSSHFKPGLRGHFIALLKTPQTKARVRDFLVWLSCQPAFAKYLRLQSDKDTPKFPVDPALANTSQPLFIAPPALCDGLEDPHPEDRWQIFEGATDTFVLPCKASAQQCLNRAVNALRKKSGLPPTNVQLDRLHTVTEVPGSEIVSCVEGAVGGRPVWRITLKSSDNPGGWTTPFAMPGMVRHFNTTGTFELQVRDPELFAKLYRKSREVLRVGI